LNLRYCLLRLLCSSFYHLLVKWWCYFVLQPNSNIGKLRY
jgi:hypothetical protein